MSDPDGLDELHALYRRLQPPPPADELAEADEATRRTVGWMREAWNALEAPRGSRARRPARRALPIRALLAAAAALVLAVLALRALRPDPGDQTAVLAPPPAVEVLDVRPDRVELRSGPVRLVLLEPPPPPRPAGG